MGVGQGYVLSPFLLNYVIDRILKEVTEMLGDGLHIAYAPVGGLYYSYCMGQ